MRIYTNVAYSVTFRFPASSIVWLGLVVGLGSVLVLFFIAFSALRFMLKDRKLTLRLAALVAQLLQSWHFTTLRLAALVAQLLQSWHFTTPV